MSDAAAGGGPGFGPRDPLTRVRACWRTGRTRRTTVGIDRVDVLLEIDVAAVNLAPG